MESPYKNFSGLDASSISERVRCARAVCLEMLRDGTATVEKLQDCLSLFEEEERFEIAEGAKRAIQEFQANPQLSLI